MTAGRLPNFIVIGAGKSGTTSLNQQLAAHPQIYMSPLKEPAFFCWEDLDPARNHFAVKSMREYTRLFDAAPAEGPVGEVTPHYLARPKAAARIAAAIPHCKLIALLRNPVDRAFSLYSHFRRDGVETIESFEDAIERSPFRWYYVDEGMYGHWLSHYFERFPREQVRVFLYEDYRASPASVLSDIHDFLGVDDLPPTEQVARNVSGVPRSPVLRAVLRTLGRPRIRGLARHALPHGVRERAAAGLHAWIGRDVVRLELPRAARETLAARYEEDVRLLETLLERDLTSWRTPTGGTA